VLRYVDADVVQEACRRAPMSRSAVAADGTVTDRVVREELAAALLALHRRVSAARDAARG
jgi:hypothetical protein